MPTNLEQLIEMARKHTMTENERDAQVRSFAYGNTHFENATITRSDVDHAVDTLNSDRVRTIQA